MRTLAAFLRSERGSFGVLAALTLPLTIGFAALGTDYGYFLYDRQQLQHSVDLAALSAAAMASEEDETARRIVADNGYEGAEIEVTLGSVEAGIDGRTVFREGRAGGAVRVEARRPTSLFFSRLYLTHAPVLAASAIAEVQPAVSLGLGSRLAVASGGIPAALTGALLGSRIDLSVLGYDGLVRSKLTAQGLLAALADTLGLAGATVGDVLDRDVSVKLLVQAVAQTLRKEGQPVPAANVAHVAYDLARSDATIRLGEILSLPQSVRDLSVKSPSSYLTADLSAAGLLTAALSPRRSGSALDTTLSVPGLLSTRLELLVGEEMVSHPPLGIMEGAVPLSTAQVRSRLRVETGTVLGLVSAKLAVPIELAVAAGEARVVSATCNADPARRSVTVEVAPGAARLEFAETPGKLEAIGLNPSGRLVEVLSLPLVKVKAHAVASLRAFTPTRVTFTGREIGNGTVRQVGSTRMVRALVEDLFHSLTLDVRVLGLGLGLGEGPLAGVVKTALTGLAEPLDTVLDGVLAALGLKLGALDVRVDDIVCDQPRIVG